MNPKEAAGKFVHRFPVFKTHEKLKAQSILDLYPDLKELKAQGKLPEGIAIILDGNGRWAKERNLPINKGHEAGAEATKKLMFACADLGINLSTWILSPDNIEKRTPQEIHGIYKIFEENVNLLIETANENNGKIIHIGDLDGLPGHIRLKIRQAQRRTRKNTGAKLGIAINYDQIKQVMGVAENARKKRSQVPYTNETVWELMYGKGEIKPADIVIRTGMVQRLSGFGLPFVGKESELFFPPVYLPDFTEEHLHGIILEFVARNRTLGGRPDINSKTFAA